jgi:alcohol dehydrogenase class IV
MLGGLVITRTKTSVVHSLGYSLTYYWNIPHGRANGVFLEQFLRLNYSTCKDRVDKILELIGMRSMEQFGSVLKRLCRTAIRLTDDEIKHYAEAAYAKKGTHNNPAKITQEDLEKMMSAVAGGENDG